MQRQSLYIVAWRESLTQRGRSESDDMADSGAPPGENLTLDKGWGTFFEEMTASDLVMVDRAGLVVSGERSRLRVLFKWACTEK